MSVSELYKGSGTLAVAGRNVVKLLRDLASPFYENETTYTYYPPFERAARAPCGDDVRAERAPRDRGVH